MMLMAVTTQEVETVKAAVRVLKRWWETDRDVIWQYIPNNLGVKLASSFISRNRRNPYAPPKVLKPCKFCGQQYGAREMRKHLPECSHKPLFNSRKH